MAKNPEVDNISTFRKAKDNQLIPMITNTIDW